MQQAPLYAPGAAQNAELPAWQRPGGMAASALQSWQPQAGRVPSVPTAAWDVSSSAAACSRTFTVTDRQVFVEPEGEAPSLYALCRKWVQNDPEHEVEVTEPVNVLKLPAPLPREPDDRPEPVYNDDSEFYDPEEALRKLKDHWVSIREHCQERQRRRNERYRERMQQLLPGGATLTQ